MVIDKAFKRPVEREKPKGQKKPPKQLRLAGSTSAVLPKGLGEYLDEFLPSSKRVPKKEACTMAIRELERAGCQVELAPRSIGAGKILKLTMSAEMAEMLPQTKSGEHTDGLPFSSVCFRVVSCNGKSTVTISEQDTHEDAKNPASLDNAPDVLLVVLRACNMEPAAVAVENVLLGAYDPARKTVQRSCLHEPEEVTGIHKLGTAAEKVS
jgi:hypothetical protein